MNPRRSPLLLAPLLGLASLPLVTGVPAAGAAPAGHAVPAARGPKPGEPGGGDKGSAEKEKQKSTCPTELWNIPIEIKGLACILLLPKNPPPPPDDQSGGGGQPPYSS
jgi:hypothetical protein